MIERAPAVLLDIDGTLVGSNYLHVHAWARARAAKAEAEAKAAEAARLEDRAATHRGDVEASRDDLDKRSEQADRLDPTAREDDGARTSRSEA